MLLFRPPLLKFGLAGVLPANFATGGDFDSPLVNDAVSPDDDNTEFLWALLTPLIDGTSGGTTDVDDLGFYGHVGGADGTYLQDYRVLKMPPTGAVPAAEEATITVNIGSGGASLDLDPATLALSGALSIGGDIQIGTSFDLASDPVALSGSLAVSGDIESSVDPIWTSTRRLSRWPARLASAATSRSGHRSILRPRRLRWRAASASRATSRLARALTLRLIPWRCPVHWLCPVTSHRPPRPLPRQCTKAPGPAAALRRATTAGAGAWTTLTKTASFAGFERKTRWS